VRAAGGLVHLGLYFCAIRILEDNSVLLQPVLREIHDLVVLNMAEPNNEVAIHTWLWDDVDRGMFTGRFKHLKVIQQYMRSWQSLKDLGLHGVYSLLKIERELLLKVCCAAVFSWISRLLLDMYVHMCSLAMPAARLSVAPNAPADTLPVCQ
jgi:hypothetical protein